MPAYCDSPKCCEAINRGLGHVCGGDVYGGEKGCGLFFCSAHLRYERDKFLCARCSKYRKPYKKKIDHPTWVKWKLLDSSLGQWRKENPDEVRKLREQLKKGDGYV